MSILFISDLHLSPNKPQITRKFHEFLQNYTDKAEALYILGDFFSIWLGDDDDSEFNTNIITSLKQLRKRGIPIYIMHGNRDFVLGKVFMRAAHCEFLPDPIVIDLYGKKTLLTHGDTLYLEDKAYLRFRHVARNQWIQRIVLEFPLSWRRYIAKTVRKQSRGTHHIPKDTVTMSEILRMMQAYEVTQMIHGHTHCPLIQSFSNGQRELKRIVLNDWGELGNMLRCEKDGTMQLVDF